MTASTLETIRDELPGSAGATKQAFAHSLRQGS